MARFIATGAWASEEARVVWEDGKLVEVTPAEVRVDVDAVIEARSEVTFADVGGVSGRATLKEPLLALATLDAVLDDLEVLEHEGIPDLEARAGVVDAAP